MLLLFGKSVLVTGANRGIGLELVKQLTQLESAPKYVFAGCRNPEDAEALNNLAKTKDSIHVVQIDVTDLDSIRRAKVSIEAVLEDSGLNLLINNAGLYSKHTLLDVTRDDILKQFNTNTLGPLMMVQTFLPLLKLAANSTPELPMSCSRAAVINMSSGIASISENTTGGMYASRLSKVGLNMLTSNLSIDLKPEGILCSAIHPGWVNTDMGGPNALVSKEASVKGILEVMEKLQTEEETGKFYHAKGHAIGW